MTKTIFITGTSSGLGKLTALHFAKLGWNVAATMRTPETENDLTAFDNIEIFKLDVTDIHQVQAATERAIAAFGKIDVVVNNAGAGSYGPLEFAEESTIDWQFALNVRGPRGAVLSTSFARSCRTSVPTKVGCSSTSARLWAY